MGKLSDSERKAITERMQSLVLKELQAGVSTGTKVICHNCGHAKPLAGAVAYGKHRLCNDCARRYEIAKAEDDIETIEGFILAE
jgi:hypothetical protein